MELQGKDQSPGFAVKSHVDVKSIRRMKINSHEGVIPRQLKVFGGWKVD